MSRDTSCKMRSSVIGTTTQSVKASVDVGGDPFGVAFALDGSVAYVANRGADRVSVVDIATSTVASVVPLFRRQRTFEVPFVPGAPLAGVSDLLSSFKGRAWEIGRGRVESLPRS